MRIPSKKTTPFGIASSGKKRALNVRGGGGTRGGTSASSASTATAASAARAEAAREKYGFGKEAGAGSGGSSGRSRFEDAGNDSDDAGETAGAAAAKAAAKAAAMDAAAQLRRPDVLQNWPFVVSLKSLGSVGKISARESSANRVIQLIHFLPRN